MTTKNRGHSNVFSQTSNKISVKNQPKIMSKKPISSASNLGKKIDMQPSTPKANRAAFEERTSVKSVKKKLSHRRNNSDWDYSLNKQLMGRKPSPMNLEMTLLQPNVRAKKANTPRSKSGY